MTAGAQSERCARRCQLKPSSPFAARMPTAAIPHGQAESSSSLTRMHEVNHSCKPAGRSPAADRMRPSAMWRASAPRPRPARQRLSGKLTMSPRSVPPSRTAQRRRVSANRPSVDETHTRLGRIGNLRGDLGVVLRTPCEHRAGILPDDGLWSTHSPPRNPAWIQGSQVRYGIR